MRFRQLHNTRKRIFEITKFVDEGDTIAANDNDTTIPTSAAVKDYVDNNGGDGLILRGTFSAREERTKSSLVILPAKISSSNLVLVPAQPTLICLSCMMALDLVLGRARSSHVKVVLRHVSERVDLHASALGCKLVT